MHNTLTQGFLIPLFGFLLALSQGFLLALLLTRYALYLFLSGLPGFAKGGLVNGTDRCFDLYSCAITICSANGTTFTPHEDNCAVNETSYQERMPAWMEFEYEKIYSTLVQNTVLGILVACLFLLFPLFTWSLSRCGVSPLRLRITGRIYCAILILGNLACCIVIPNSILELDQYKPIMASWVNDILLTSYRLTMGCIWLQSLGCNLLLIYNQLTQLHPDIEEFRPLLPGDIVNDQEDIGWGRVERGNAKEIQSDQSE